MDLDLENLRSFLGIALIVAIGWVFSENRRAVKWRTVGAGVALQFAFAVIVLKTAPGIWFFQKVSDGVNALIDYTVAGSSFVFGPLVTSDKIGFVFAFRVLPTVIFVGAFTSVLYHLGILQRVVGAMAWVMQRVMATSGAESLSCAVNVFVGQTEAPLVVRPYLARMTRSELMAVMTGGFATIAGGVLVAYVQMGISAAHLLTASVLSAPAALVMAKLLVPETGEPETGRLHHIEIERTSVNVIDAAAAGATDGIKLAINVAAMLIAFVALVAMVDGILGWVGGLAGWQLTLAKVLGKVFWPLAWAIGVPTADCATYGDLIGTQISQTEFIAYLKLAALLPKGAEDSAFSARAAMLATYSLCGFANFGSIGIQLGGIGALVESRRHDLARLGLKAMIAGVLACNMTAAVAGVLVSQGEAEFRQAEAVARARVTAGDAEGAGAALRAVARRHGGEKWGERALEAAQRIEGGRP